MNCSEMDKYIPLFIDDKLAGDELGEFLKHIDECSSCLEEMETSFLVKEAIVRLENGGSFDLYSELVDKIKVMKQCYSMHVTVDMIRRSILVLASLSILSLLVWMAIM
ncbi:MAG: zf-HC2 domain-containing protein [Lachnospiraceae bacterium]|nr:zf-HC2 domain-containing protein [Lachnospiraceae bacterium]